MGTLESYCTRELKQFLLIDRSMKITQQLISFRMEKIKDIINNDKKIIAKSRIPKAIVT